jgi:hypothetical protein
MRRMMTVFAGPDRIPALDAGEPLGDAAFVTAFSLKPFGARLRSAPGKRWWITIERR